MAFDTFINFLNCQCFFFEFFILVYFSLLIITIVARFFSYDRGVFRFGHAETIMPLLSLLSLYRDSEPPTQHNFHSQQNRQFRASRISPFAANIGFILYECEADDSSNHRSADKTSASDSKWPTLIEKFMLVLKVNERTTRFPFCQHHLCAYSEIKQHLHRYVSTCDFKELCRVEKEKINVKDEL